MVVISACISSRVRPLLARQFVDIRRTKVEGMLNAFVKLVDYSGTLRPLHFDQLTGGSVQAAEVSERAQVAEKKRPTNTAGDLPVLVVTDLGGSVDGSPSCSCSFWSNGSVDILGKLCEGCCVDTGKTTTSGSDHTYLETESIRYVYQPVENLYLVLITTKSSNIFEDLGTLRMFVSIVQETCGESHGSGSLEDSVAAHAFDIVFMLDELISGGYREALTLQQIQSYVAMDSHEEKLQRMIAEGKEKEQADRRREIAQRLEKEKQAAKKAGKGLDITAFRGTTGAPQLMRGPPALSASQGAPPRETYWASSSPSGGTYEAHHQPSPSVTPGASKGGQQSKGMQLGFKTPAGGVDSSLQNLVPDEQIKPTSGYAEAQHDQVLDNPLADPVSVLIEEKVKASLQAEGVLKEVELQGTFFVTANDPQRGSLAAFQLTPEDKRFKMKSHPNVDKAALSQNSLLQVRDPSRPLPPHQPAPLLKWRVSEKDESLVPLTVSCWPSSTPTGTVLTVELEVTDTSKRLEDVRVSFMCPAQANPQVLRTDAGTTEHDGVSVVWTLPEMGQELSAATIELTANTSLTTLMPFSVEMHSRENVCNVEVLQCNHMETKAEIPFSLTRKVDYLLTVHP